MKKFMTFLGTILLLYSTTAFAQVSLPFPGPGAAAPGAVSKLLTTSDGKIINTSDAKFLRSPGTESWEKVLKTSDDKLLATSDSKILKTP